MGVPINAQLNDNSNYINTVKRMCKIIADNSISPLYRELYPFTINFFRERLAVKELHAHTNKIIDTKLKECTVKNKKSTENECGIKRRLAFLDLLIEAEIDGVALSKEEIREEVDTFMFEVDLSCHLFLFYKRILTFMYL